MKVGDKVLVLDPVRQISEGFECFEIVGFTNPILDNDNDSAMICLKNVKNGHNGNSRAIFNEKGNLLENPYNGYQYWFEMKNRIIDINNLDKLYENRHDKSIEKYLQNNKLI